MAILGGSPLGLIGVLSRPDANGLSTFNGGKSRNVNVNLYNVGKETDKEKLSKFGAKGGMFSLFTGGTIISAWPNIGQIGSDKVKVGTGPVDTKGVSRKTLHNNDIYDTSILNIIEKTANTRAQVRPSDFAYLKNLGVLPNNRLVIARRFQGPVEDDIFTKGSSPLAILITWRLPSEDFLEISFGEEWIDAEADFTNLLNNMGQDLLKMGSSGGSLASALNVIPLPGFTESITRTLLEELGIYSKGSGQERLPAGNPNLIKQAKRRKTIGPEEAGSGLRCTCSVKMLVEWEQKFISGIDPTIAWMDILTTCVRFGTSPETTYGLSKDLGAKLVAWSNNPKLIVSEFTTSLRNALDKAKEDIKTLLTAEEEPDNTTVKDKKGNIDEAKTAAAEKEAEATASLGFLDELIAKVGDSIGKSVQKYEHAIRGIVSALSGLPSTPWHVTIGNPLRPVFCSGDMHSMDFNLKLGSTLAFNDLPANISLDFTLTNARAWGLDKIISKFNTGHIRVVNTQKDFTTLTPSEQINQGKYDYSSGTSGTSGLSGTNGTAGGGGVNGKVDNKVDPNSGSTTTPTKEGQDSKTINSDPNSSQPPVEGETKKESMGTSGTSGMSGTSGNSTGAVDPVGDANATSKRGYTYTITIEGNLKRIKVIDKESTVILTKTFSDEVPDGALIAAAKATTNDV
jgi:hypothetical protein